jgi:UDP-GlcNAc:undecaprenyl-phosphate GlcNAc-1-phosphate transferase
MANLFGDDVRRAALFALFAIGATLAALAVLRPFAPMLGLVDRPTHRKAHSAPTPAIGGLAIIIGFAPFALYLLPVTMQLRGFAIASFIILAAGIADDRRQIRWQFRLCAHVAAALALIYVGGIRIEQLGRVLGFPITDLGPLSTPLTVLATVGIINAVNMIDGVDGLAGTVGVVALGLLAGAAAYAGNVRLASSLILLIGGLSAFLLVNLRTPWNPRAMIFIGNAGAEFLGLVIADASFRLTQNPAHPVGAQLAPFLIAPPLIDCLVLIACRLRRGRSPFHADRNHMHHLLLDAGYSVTAVVTVIAGVTLLIGLSAAVALKAHAPGPLFAVAFAGLIVAHFCLTHRHDRAVAILAILRRRLTIRISGAADPSPALTAPAPAQTSLVKLPAFVPLSDEHALDQIGTASTPLRRAG